MSPSNGISGLIRIRVANLRERFDRADPEQGVPVPENGCQGGDGLGVPQPPERGRRVAAGSIALPQEELALDLAPGRGQPPDVDPHIILIGLAFVTQLLQDFGEEVEESPQPVPGP